MAEPPELWVFLVVNSGLFVVGSALTVLSYLAIRRSRGQRSFVIATAGFGFVVSGGLAAPVFQLASGIDYTLNGSQVLLIESIETAFTALGLGLLFYAITQYDDTSPSTAEDGFSSTDEGIDWTSNQQYSD